MQSPPRTELAVAETPQARYDAFGGPALSDTELLALFIHDTPLKASIMASSLITKAGSLAALARWHANDYQTAVGVGRTTARRLAAVTELCRRFAAPIERPLLNRPELVYARLRPQTVGLTVEHFWVLTLDKRNRLIQQTTLTIGTGNSTLAHPREVFRVAVRDAAAVVVCVHNHPSCDPSPSAGDVRVTRQLRDAGRTMDIDVLDHVILGQPHVDPMGRGYYSFREAGLL